MTSMMNALVEVASTAGKIALAKREEQLEISMKEHSDRPGTYDIVSNADVAVEEYIVNNLRMRHGSFEFVSEETHERYDVPQCCFVIDPIDGTINFANGFPLWGVQIACVMGGRTVAAVIHLPEVGRTYSADENGAYLNGKPISVSNLGLDEGLYSIDGPDRLAGRTELVLRGYSNLRDFYSTCVGFSMVAGGTSCAAVYAYKCPWDYLPGEFIVKMAGGVIYDDFERDVHIVANSKGVLDEMIGVFCSDDEPVSKGLSDGGGLVRQETGTYMGSPKTRTRRKGMHKVSKQARRSLARALRKRNRR